MVLWNLCQYLTNEKRQHEGIFSNEDGCYRGVNDIIRHGIHGAMSWESGGSVDEALTRKYLSL